MNRHLGRWDTLWVDAVQADGNDFDSKHRKRRERRVELDGKRVALGEKA